MTTAAKLEVKIRADIEQLKRSMAEMRKEVAGSTKASQKSVEKIDRSFKNLEKTMSGVGKSMTIGFTAPILAAGTAGLKTAGEFEQSSIAFEVMLGSAEKAKNIMEDLTEFSAKTPFQLGEITNASRQLIAFGEDSESVVETLGRIGDVASGVGMSVGELSAIYGKNMVQNLVQAQDLNQLAGRGIPIFTELAKVMGVNADEIRKLGSEGKITFTELEQAFINMTSEGGQFADMMSKQSESLFGLLSTLKDNVVIFLNEAVQPLVPHIKKIIDSLTQATQILREMSPATKAAIVNFAGVLAIAGPLTLGITKVTVAFNGLKLAMATNPIGIIAVGATLAIAALAGLSAALDDSSKYLEEEAERLKKVKEEQKQYQEVLSAAARERIALLVEEAETREERERILNDEITLLENEIQAMRNAGGEANQYGTEVWNLIEAKEEEIRVRRTAIDLLHNENAVVKQAEQQKKQLTAAEEKWLAGRRSVFAEVQELSDNLYLNEEQRVRKATDEKIKQLKRYRKANEDISQQIAVIKEDEQRQLEEIQKKGTQTIIDSIQIALQHAQQIGSQINDIISQLFRNQEIELENRLQRQKDKLLEWYEFEKIIIDQSAVDAEERAGRMRALDEERNRREMQMQEKADKQKRKLAREQAIYQKKSAVFSIIISTAQAIMQAWATLPTWAAAAMSAVIGTLSKIQIGTVLAEPLPALAQGGVTTGAALALIGEGKHQEAVLPLSTEVFDRLAQGLHRAMGKDQQGTMAGSSAAGIRQQIIVNVGNDQMFSSIQEGIKNGQIIIEAGSIA